MITTLHTSALSPFYLNDIKHLIQEIDCGYSEWREQHSQFSQFQELVKNVRLIGDDADCGGNGMKRTEAELIDKTEALFVLGEQ